MKKISLVLFCLFASINSHAERVWLNDVKILGISSGWFNDGYHVTLKLNKMPINTSCPESSDNLTVSHWYSKSSTEFQLKEVDKMFSSAMFAKSNKALVDINVEDAACSSKGQGLFFGAIRIKE